MPDQLKSLLKSIPPLVQLVRAVRAANQKRLARRRRLPSFYQPGIDAYLRSHTPGKLQIGSGPHLLPGWLNTDYEPVSDESVFMDATRTFPLPDQAFTHVFSEHMIEHISYEQGLFMLRESFRVLKPGGKIRLATPNLKNIIDLSGPEKSEVQKRYLDWAMTHFWPNIASRNACFVINNFMRNWGHLFVYDAPTLRFSLEQAGFADVREYPPGTSEEPAFLGLECHGKQIGEENNQFETMVLEAMRPR